MRIIWCQYVKILIHTLIREVLKSLFLIIWYIQGDLFGKGYFFQICGESSVCGGGGWCKVNTVQRSPPCVLHSRCGINHTYTVIATCRHCITGSIFHLLAVAASIHMWKDQSNLLMPHTPQNGNTLQSRNTTWGWRIIGRLKFKKSLLSNEQEFWSDQNLFKCSLTLTKQI